MSLPIRLIIATSSSLFFISATAQVPSGVLKKSQKTEPKIDATELVKPRPILSFDPADATKTPILVNRVPIRFKAKQQPMMIGRSPEPLPAAPN